MCTTMVVEGTYELDDHHYHERNGQRSIPMLIGGIIAFISLFIIVVLTGLLIRCKYYDANCSKSTIDLALERRVNDGSTTPEIRMISSTDDQDNILELSFSVTPNDNLPSSTIDVDKYLSSVIRHMDDMQNAVMSESTSLSSPGSEPTSDVSDKSEDSMNRITRGLDESTSTTEVPTDEKDVVVIKRLRFGSTVASTVDESSLELETTVSSAQPLNDSNSVNGSINYHRNDHFLKCIEDPHICGSGKCKTSAAKMLALMDHSTDPCKDFYKYSCGGLQLNGIKLNKPEMGVHTALKGTSDFMNSNYSIPHLSKLKKFHESCTNHNPMSNSTPEMLIKVLNFFNKNDNTGKKEDDLTDFLATVILHNPFEITQRLLPIFDIKLDAGADKKFTPIITLPLSPIFTAKSQDSMDLYEQNCLQETEKSMKTEPNTNKIYEYYINCLNNNTLFFANLQESLTNMHFADNFPQLAVGPYMEFIEKTAIPELGTITRLDIIKNMRLKAMNMNVYNLEELSLLYPAIDWTKLFQRLFNTTSFDSIKLIYPEYIDKIFGFYNKHNLGEIKVTLLAMLSHDLYLQYLKPQNPNERILLCEKIVMNLMPDTMTNIYLTQFHKPDIIFMQERAQSIFRQTVATLKDLIYAAAWLSESGKNKLRNAVDEMQLICSQDSYLNDQLLDQEYADLEITNVLLENIFSLKQHRREHNYRAINKVADSSSVWVTLVSPISPDAVSLLSLKAVVTPITLISQYYYEKKFEPQDYEVLSRFGNVIAQKVFEILNIKAIEVLLNYSAPVFKSYIDDQLLNPDYYKQMSPYVLKFDINDLRLSLNTRFADESALSLMNESYGTQETKDLPLIWLNMSISKLFYISYAQEFCSPIPSKVVLAIELSETVTLPNYYRVNAVLQNSKQFAEAFECFTGTPMNRSNKTQHFPRIS